MLGTNHSNSASLLRLIGSLHGMEGVYRSAPLGGPRLPPAALARPARVDQVAHGLRDGVGAAGRLERRELAAEAVGDGLVPPAGALVGALRGAPAHALDLVVRGRHGLLQGREGCYLLAIQQDLVP